jgi:sigma-B regulation protein RsbU (phosphoserine phosphatase)
MKYIKSIRTRTTIVLVLIIAVAALPLIYLTRASVVVAMRNAEERSLSNILHLVELNIDSSYSRLLSSKFTTVTERKANLRQTAVRVSTFLNELPDSNVNAAVKMVNSLNSVSKNTTRVFLYDTKGDLISGLVDIDAKYSLCNIQDMKDRDLAQVAVPENLPPDGEFTVFQHARSTEKAKSLVFFFPMVSKGWSIGVFTSLADIQAAADVQLSKLISSLAATFSKISVYETGYITLFSGTGEVMINTSLQQPDTSVQAAIINAAGSGHRTMTINDPVAGEIEFRFVYIRPLDWYVLVAAPVAEIQKPAYTLFNQQVAIIFFIAIWGFLFALFIAQRLIKPIEMLSNFALRLPRQDFTEQNVINELTAELPVKRTDEVGDLARSIRFMCEELNESVSTMMAATAAKERIQSELVVAREIQEGMLPKTFPAYPDRNEFTLYAALDSAKEVGGDLYDFFFVDDDHLCLVVGDVSDNGVPAALYMAVTVATIRSTMQEGVPVHVAMEKINDVLSQDNPRSMFVTLFIGVLHVPTGTMQFASGGHLPPVLVHNGKPHNVHGVSGLVVGGMEGSTYTSFELQLEKNDTLFIYTDGVTEAMNKQKELYGTDRLLALMEAKSSLRLGDLLYEVRKDVDAFSDGAPQSDDITMLVLRYKGSEQSFL